MRIAIIDSSNHFIYNMEDQILLHINKFHLSKSPFHNNQKDNLLNLQAYHNLIHSILDHRNNRYFCTNHDHYILAHDVYKSYHICILLFNKIHLYNQDHIDILHYSNDHVHCNSHHLDTYN